MSDNSDSRDEIFDTEHLQKDIRAHTGKASNYVIIFSAVKFFITIGTTAVLARLVSPSEYGIVALATPIVLIAASLSEFGLADVMVQRKNMTHNIASSLFWVNVFLGLFLGSLVALLAKPAVIFYDEPRVGPVFVVLGLMVFFSALVTQYIAILRRLMRIRTIEIGTLGASICSVLVTILLAKLGAGYWAIVGQSILTPAFIFIILFFLTGWTPSAPWRISPINLKEFLTFGGFLASSRMLLQITQNMGMIIVGRFFSDQIAGLYYRSWTLANIPQTRIFSSLAGAYVPALSRLQETPDIFREVFVRMIIRMNLIAMPVGIGIFSSADIIVKIILGDQWTSAGPILGWLGILTFTAPTLNGFQWALISSGNAKQLFYFRIFAGVVTIGALLVGLQFGLLEIVTIYMMSILLVQLPVLGMLTVRYTKVTAQNLLHVCVLDFTYAGVVLGIVLLVRRKIDQLPLFYEVVLVGCVIGLAYFVRVLMNSELRTALANKLLTLVSKT